jgi:hemolysin III
VIPEIISYLGLRHPVATAAHAVGAVLAVLGTYLLWRRGRGNPRAQIVAISFGISAVFLYAASATYHALQVPWEQLRYFLLLDVCAIFVLIAGTYTPIVLLIVPPGWRRMGFFTLVWLMAAAGIAFRILTFTGVLSQGPYWAVVLIYLSMGWLGLALVLDMVRAVGFRGLQWLIYGGLAYTIGVGIDVQHEPNIWPGVIGYHELFHVFVVAGSFCHFVFIWNYVMPYALNDSVDQSDEPMPEFAGEQS